MNIYTIREEVQALEEIGLTIDTPERYFCFELDCVYSLPLSVSPSWPMRISCSSGARSPQPVRPTTLPWLWTLKVTTPSPIKSSITGRSYLMQQGQFSIRRIART
jgi:hypothetical protein